jgi:hypothetical protein
MLSVREHTGSLLMVRMLAELLAVVYVLQLSHLYRVTANLLANTRSPVGVIHLLPAVNDCACVY